MNHLSPLGGKDVKQAKEVCVDLAVGRHNAGRKGTSHDCALAAMEIALLQRRPRPLT